MAGSGTPRIGVALGSVGADASWWLESARRLDDAGYAGVWCWDHFVGKGDRTVPVLEQWTTLAAAAAVTRRAGIGSFVANVMHRHPAVLARAAATVQQISGGRLSLGIGIGGSDRGHRAYGIEFPEPAERAARLEEAIGVIRALWTGGPVTRSGRFYPLEDAVAFPRPDPVPAILVGAGTPAGVRLAARAGDGWAAESPGYEALRPGYLDALAAAGRSRADVRIVVGFGGGRTGVDALAESPWLGDRDAVAARWAELDADEVIVTARTTADVDRLVAAAGR
ncbi:MAG TPA: LLM class flavin-dependent oxidoreductase [Candidatus Limnocylindrales bacterium]|nr:LLM class flavin-dependent oxidoreductase [Candidatus Limnocylindrales bacterium]